MKKLSLMGLLLAFCLHSPLNAHSLVNNVLDLKPLNAFGVDGEFLASVDNTQTYQNIQRTLKGLIKHYDANGVFIPTIKSMLIQANVPVEFLFLAMAESHFAIDAKSGKKAVGIWQFIPETAKMLGLEVNRYIDERRDPIKSTQAAISYFQMLYKQTGQWYLVAMAYNCGPGRVLQAIKEARSDELNVLLNEDKKFLPKETRNYIRSILSLAIAFSNVDALEHKEYLLNRGSRMTLASLEIQGGTLLAKVAKGARLSLSELKSYNHQFKYNFLPIGQKSMVYIPYENLAYFRQHYKPSKDIASNFISHKVKPRESLYSIAKKFHVSIEMLKMANNLKGSFLSRNQNLIIPILKKQPSEKNGRKVAQNEFIQ
ncbi:lytic transglycosylase domain-containing protein [Helicobacter bizzozeronii]|uniref:lytic transglycosylase domain-containing protein n=1 Tax=Helicobacter bizzozeronii TaxID=56877 RepID=UPI000CF07930|nr:lytic transglycosylase domain-containing protein [Helicobacter bizzozeronii]